MIVEFLVEHGARLAAGATAVLALGSAAAFVAREPLVRQRIAEGAMLALFVWLGVALIPRSRPTTPPPETPGIQEPLSLPIETPSRLLVERRTVDPLPAAENDPIATVGTLESLRRVSDLTALAASPNESPSAISTVPADRWPERFAIGYLAGCGFAIMVLVVGHWRLRRLVRRARPAPLEAAVLFEDLDRPRYARLLMTDANAPPMSFGWRRPTVLIPATLTDAGPAALRNVLRHEVAHLRHGDALGRALFNLAAVVCWWNPLYWHLRRQAEFAAELRADDAAAAEDGAAAYVGCLLTYFERAATAGAPPAASLLLRSRSVFFRRMTMLLARQKPVATRTSATWRVGAATLGLGVAMALGAQFGVVYAHEPPRKTKTIEAPPTKDPIATPAAVEYRLTRAAAAADPFDPVAAPQPPREIADGWEALGVAIAERRARAASLAGDEHAAANLLRLQAEIASLEGSRQELTLEKRIAELQRRMMALEEQMATLQAKGPGSSHSDLKPLETQVRLTEAARERAQLELEKTRALADRRVKATAAELHKTLARTAETQKAAPANVRKPNATSERTPTTQEFLAKLQVENDNLRMQMQMLERNNIALQKEIAAIRGTAPPTAGSETSLPMLRYRLKLAETEPAILQPQVELQRAEMTRLEALMRAGSVAVSEVNLARSKYAEAEARMKRARVEVESLRETIAEIESREWAAKPPPAKTKTSR